MATGEALPVLKADNLGHGSTASGSTINFNNTFAEVSRFRTFVTYARNPSSTSPPTLNSFPSYMAKHIDIALGHFRVNVFTWPVDVNDLTTSGSFTYSSSVWWSGVSTGWVSGIDPADPLMPVNGSALYVATNGTTGTSLTCPTVTPGVTGAVMLWYPAAYYSASASGKAPTGPADLVSAGFFSPTTSVGCTTRQFGWLSSLDSDIVLRTPNPTGTKAFTFPATPASTAVIGIGLRVADAGLYAA